MTDQELENILASEPEIQPSPGFAAAVMKSVHREVAAPPPLGFPWLCAIPGMLAWGITFFSIVSVWFLQGNSAEGTASPRRFPFSLDLPWVSAHLGAMFGVLTRTEAGWIFVALILTVACVRFPLQLIRGRFRG